MSQTRTVNISKKDDFFYVVLVAERLSKSRVFSTLVAAQNHAKRLLRKEGTILNKDSLPIGEMELVAHAER